MAAICHLMQDNGGSVRCIGYNTVWSELIECNEQTHFRQCCNVLVSWPLDVGDVFIEAWLLLVWSARPICQRLSHAMHTDSREAVCSELWLLTHPRHNAGDRCVKVGLSHEIRVVDKHRQFSCSYNCRLKEFKVNRIKYTRICIARLRERL